MNWDRRKTALVALIGLGLLATIVTAGTLASFTATTTNPNNVFQGGTVTMTNVAGSVIAGSNCAVATNNGTCATLFSNAGGSANTANLKPGGADTTNSATITYTGTLTPTSDFRLFAANYTSKLGASSALCTATNPGSQLDLQITVGPAASATVIYPSQAATLNSALTSGTAYTSLTVTALPAQITSGSSITLFSGTHSQTVVAAATAAAGATTVSVNSFTANFAYPLSSQILTGTGYGTLDAFATTYTSSSNGLQLKGGTNGSGSAGVWATNDNSAFNFNVHLDTAAGNSYQGCQSQTDLDWYTSQ